MSQQPDHKPNSHWPPIQPGEVLDLRNRLNWLGWMLNKFIGAEVRRGTEDRFYISEANIVLELAIPPAAAEATPTGEIPIGGGAAGAGATGMVYSGAWSSGGSYAEDEVVIHTEGDEQGLFIRITGGGGAGTEPFTSGYATDWTLLARNFTTKLVVFVSSTEKIEIDADANTIVLTNGSTVITMDAQTTTPKIQVTDGTDIAKLELGASNEIRITDGSSYTYLKKDKIYHQNAAGTIKLDWDGSSNEKLRVDFSDGGSAEISKTACGAKDLTVQAFGVCDAGAAKTALFLASAPY